MGHRNYSKFSEHFKKSESQETINEINDKITEEVVNEPATVETEIIETQEEVTIVTGKVSGCEKLNVRENPSIDAKVLCVLNRTDEVRVDLTNTMEDWYKVCTSAGIEGYCMAKYINL